MPCDSRRETWDVSADRIEPAFKSRSGLHADHPDHQQFEREIQETRVSLGFSTSGTRKGATVGADSEDIIC